MQAGAALGNLANVFGAQAAGRPEEATVIAELKAGSEEAFASLIAQYHAPLYSLIARTIPDPCEAADITQDVPVTTQMPPRRLTPASIPAKSTAGTCTP